MPSAMSRRDVLAVLASTAALPLASACRSGETSRAPAGDMEAPARALLDELGETFLRLSPERATSLGIDTGPRAALRADVHSMPKGMRILESSRHETE